MVDIPPPGVPPADEAMIREELDRALRAITARRERRKHVYTFASGPEAGEYYPIAEALVDRVVKLDQTLKVRNAETAGSVENVRLIGTKEADYALVQSNVAAMAAAGEGPFAQGGAVTSLRALGSLFPEPVHIVVPAASGIRTVADLRGKRVALGPPDSGTRADALAILAVHGLTVKDLGGGPGRRPGGRGRPAPGRPARRLLRDGRGSHPGAPAPGHASPHPPGIAGRRRGRAARHGAPGPRPAPDPRQHVPGPEGGRDDRRRGRPPRDARDVPESEAALVLRLVFENPDYLPAGSAQGAKISKRSGLRGITIPVHPAVSRYFGPRRRQARARPARRRRPRRPLARRPRASAGPEPESSMLGPRAVAKLAGGR